MSQWIQSRNTVSSIFSALVVTGLVVSAAITSHPVNQRPLATGYGYAGVGPGGIVASEVAFPGATFGVYVAAGNIGGIDDAEIMVGAGFGAPPIVRIFRKIGSSMVPICAFRAYASTFTGGVRVAAGNVTGTDFAEIITVGGPGATQPVRVWRYVGGRFCALPVSSFSPFGSLRGGAYVAAGNVSGGAYDEIITGDGPHSFYTSQVRVFGAFGSFVRRFFPYGSYRRGIRVASGQWTPGGFDEIITGTGPGAPPRAKAFSSSGVQLAQRDVFVTTNTRGIYVAVSAVDAVAGDDIVIGAGEGNTPVMKYLRAPDFAVIRDFLAFSTTSRVGVRVAGADVNADGDGDAIAGAGPGDATLVKIFD